MEGGAGVTLIYFILQKREKQISFTNTQTVRVLTLMAEKYCICFSEAFCKNGGERNGENWLAREDEISTTTTTRLVSCITNNDMIN